MKIALFLFIISVTVFINRTPVQAQDTIYFRTNEILVCKITEVSDSQIKYKKLSGTEGPVFVLSKSDLSKIIYQDGTVALIADPRYKCKLYNPSFHFSTGVMKGDKVNNWSENPNYVGLGHDGLFKLLNMRGDKLSLGLFYSLNLSYDKAYIYDSIGNNYGYYENLQYIAWSWEISNPYGVQFDFGRDHFRMYFQAMFGPVMNFYTGALKTNNFAFSGGFGFGLKVYRVKFGIKAIVGNNDIYDRYKEVGIRIGIEL